MESNVESKATGTSMNGSLVVMDTCMGFRVSEAEVKETSLSGDSEFVEETIWVSYNELNSPHAQKHLWVNDVEIIEEDYNIFGDYDIVKK